MCIRDRPSVEDELAKAKAEAAAAKAEADALRAAAAQRVEGKNDAERFVLPVRRRSHEYTKNPVTT